MTKHDLIVIGSGPGGYIAAIRAAQLGLDTACIDDNEQLGGTCLRVGCIPSKALLESSHRYHEANTSLADFGFDIKGVALDLERMLKRKDKVVAGLTGGVAALFKKNKVKPYRGRARLAGSGQVIVSHDGEETSLEATHILLATGTEPAPLKGVELDFDRIGTSTEALAYAQVPEHLVVIGAGYIGVELGSVWSRLGSRVTILEYLDRILPGTDAELARHAKKLFEKQGLSFELGRRVTAARVDGERCIVDSAEHDPIECDRVLLSVGRRPVTADLGLEEVGVVLDERGYIRVDEQFKTSAEGVYAVGDVIGGAQLAHKAEDEGVACVEGIATGYGHVNYDVIPAVVYTHPELAMVGKTEEQLKEDGVTFRKGVFRLRANSRAHASGETEGFVKMLVADDTDRIVGVHIMAPGAGELIAEAAAAMEFGATAEDLFRTCHAHPTLSEAVREAALATAGRTLNA